MQSAADLVEGREDDGVGRVVWEVDLQSCSVLCVRVGLNGSYGVQHFFKFIWVRHDTDME